MEKIKFIIDNWGEVGCDLLTLVEEAEAYFEKMDLNSLSDSEVKQIRDSLEFQVERVREILDLSVGDVK